MHEYNAAIRSAAKTGHTEIVSILLQDSRVDPTTQWNFAIRRAARNGHTAVVALLLQDPRVERPFGARGGFAAVNPAALENYAIRWAAAKGQTAVVALLLQDPRVDPTELSNQAIRKAAMRNHTETVTLLMKDPRVNPNGALKKAARYGHERIVSLLINDSRITYNTIQQAIKCAFDIKTLDILTQCTAALAASAPFSGRIIFPEAIANNRVNLVKQLLTRMPPYDYIIIAARLGRTQIVDLLLNDSRLLLTTVVLSSPQSVLLIALNAAVTNGHTKTVRRLMKDPRVDPAMYTNAIIIASEKGHVAIVVLLLKNSRVNPAARDNEAIRCAAEHGHTAVVAVLLQDPRVDPAAMENYAIRRAAWNRHTEVVAVLLQDARVDPAAQDNSAIIVSANCGANAARFDYNGGFAAIVAQLFRDARVRDHCPRHVYITVLIHKTIYKICYLHLYMMHHPHRTEFGLIQWIIEWDSLNMNGGGGGRVKIEK